MSVETKGSAHVWAGAVVNSRGFRLQNVFFTNLLLIVQQRKWRNRTNMELHLFELVQIALKKIDLFCVRIPLWKATFRLYVNG